MIATLVLIYVVGIGFAVPAVLLLLGSEPEERLSYVAAAGLVAVFWPVLLVAAPFAYWYAERRIRKFEEGAARDVEGGR